MVNCLDTHALCDYLAGRTSDQLTQAFELHLEHCLHCQQRLAQIEPQTDHLVAAIRQSTGKPGYNQGPALEQALSAASSQFSSSNHSSPESLCDDALGQFVRDCQLLDKLGEGGMGTVYLATHVWLQKLVVVKVLKAERKNDPQAISRFEREMRAVGRLEHPNIVRALDAGHENNRHFLVMEYISGIDLARLAKRLGPLPVADACELVRQAALGLHHAHQNDLVHRDVKPSNLMLSAEGRVKVLDLGLAQFLLPDAAELTQENQLLGTWRYVAPEQLIPHASVNAASDVYSLGVTLYELLVGPDEMRRHPLPLVDLDLVSPRNDVPQGIWELLQRMLTKRQAARPDSMLLVAQSLAHCCVGANLSQLLLSVGSNEQYDTIHANDKLNDDEVLSVLAYSRSKSANHAQIPTTPIAELSTDKVPAPVPPPISIKSAGNIPTTARTSAWRQGLLIAGVVSACVLSASTGYFMPGFLGVSTSNPGAGTVPTDVTPPPPALVKVIVDCQDPLVQGLFEDKAIQLESDSGETFVAVLGPQELPPGNYQLQCKATELQLQSQELALVVGSTARLTPTLRSASSLVPQIPDEAGHYTGYKGSLWHLPFPKEQRKYFDISFTTLGEEIVDGKQCRWLQVEIVQALEEGNYTETGYILVDMGRWRTAQQLGIQRGWLLATSPMLKLQMEELDADGHALRLVTEFSPDRDTLLDMANKHGLSIPERRLSLHEALVLLFDEHDISAVPSPVRAARAVVSALGERQLSRKVISGPYGNLPTLAIAMVPADGTSETKLAPSPYIFYRNDTLVPFGFAQIDVQHVTFESRMKVISYGQSVSPPTSPSESQWREQLAKWNAQPQRAVPFDQVQIPETPGSTAQYHGRADAGRTSVPFDITLRADGQEQHLGRACRRLFLATTSQASGEQAAWQESATVLVDEAALSEGRFELVAGYLQAENHTFSIGSAGDVRSIVNGLRMQGKRVPQSRIGVTEALMLLFDAKSLSLSKIGHDLQEARDRLLTAGHDRHRKTEFLTLPDGTRVLGELWRLPESQSAATPYLLKRSRHIPFHFHTLSFSGPAQVTLSIQLKHTHTTPVTPPAIDQLERQARATADEIDKLSENWQTIQRNSDRSPLEVEFGAVIGKNAYFMNNDDKAIVVPLADLPSETQQRLQAGRVWIDVAGHRKVAQFYREREDVVDLKEKGAVRSFDINTLSPHDQFWVRMLAKYQEPRP